MRAQVGWVILMAVGCGPAAPKARALEPAATVTAEAEPEVASSVERDVDAPVQRCGQDPATESPIHRGEVGDGDRVVEIANNSGKLIQARLLTVDEKAALPGTLVIDAGEQGVFRVPAGTYLLRYRIAGTCEVRKGKPLELTGVRGGVQIGVRPLFEQGSKSNMRPVEEPL